MFREAMKRFAWYNDEAEGGGAAAPPTPEPVEAPNVVDRSVLPPEFQNYSDAELKVMLGNVTKTILSQREEIDNLRQSRLQATEPPAAPPTPVDARPLEDRILDDPETVIDEVIQKRYGSRFAAIEGQVGEGAFTLAERRIGAQELREHEEDIRAILAQNNVSPTVQAIETAYDIALGRRTRADRQRAARESTITQQTLSPETPVDPGPVELSVLEDEIRRGIGISKEKWLERKAKAGGFLSVPTGR